MLDVLFQVTEATFKYSDKLPQNSDCKGFILIRI